MDRSVKSGTGFAGQYRAEVAKIYESPASTPDELLLFFHHVPYTYRLHSGKTVIQSLYDSHYEGAEAAANYVRQWRKLQGLIDERRYQEVLAQLEYQAGQAEVWRDAVVNWFLKTSGIPDEKGRAGKHPGRMEAESMQLEGYTPVPVTPWEAASGGMAVSCAISRCAARFVFKGSPGRHDIRIRYFDQNNGAARFRLLVNGELLDQWVASDRLPSAEDRRHVFFAQNRARSCAQTRRRDPHRRVARWRRIRGLGLYRNPMSTRTGSGWTSEPAVHGRSCSIQAEGKLPRSPLLTKKS